MPGYPVTPILSVSPALRPVRPALVHLAGFGAWVAVVLVFYLVWGRHHSALNDGGDGLIPTAAPGDDDVEFVTRSMSSRRTTP